MKCALLMIALACTKAAAATPASMSGPMQLGTSAAADRSGQLWIAYSEHEGALAVYFAYSEDRGASWRGDFKLADRSCECCRIALASEPRGRVAATIGSPRGEGVGSLPQSGCA